MMAIALRNKNILITGASSGIGRELALALAQRGNRVIVAARQLDALQALAQMQPDRLIPLRWDVSDATSIQAVQNFVRAQFDWLDVAILNAGTCEYIENGAVDRALIERVLAVNFSGAINSVDALLPLLKRAQQRPYLVGISSMSTFVPLPRAEAYGASKAALRYFLESLRVDIGDRIDISIVSPGFVKTPLTDRNDFSMPFIISAEEAVRRILHGMERRQSHIAFPRRLAWSLYLLAALPTPLAVRLLRIMTKG